MNTLIEEQAPTSRGSLLRRGLAAAVVAVALVGGSVTGAQALPYTAGGVSPGGITLTATGLSGNATTGYTLDVAANNPGNNGLSGTITVTASGTGLDPAVSDFPENQEYRYDTENGDVIPVGNGAYVSLGRADGLPASDGAPSSDRSAAKTYWLHTGTLDRVQPGSEANWTPTPGSFTVTFTIPWTYNTTTQKYTLGTSTTASGGTADRTFQVYTLNALGAPDATNERVVDLTLSTP